MNIGVKQGFPLSPNIFGIYIEKLEKCLEEASCADRILTGIFIILLLYPNDIVLMEMDPFVLDKQLRILKDFCSNMSMIVNTEKTKIMIIKSKKITYANLIYDNINIEEVTSYKYLRIDTHHKLNWNYSIEKGLMEGGNLILVLKISVNESIWSCGIKRSSSLKLLTSLLSCMEHVKYGSASFLDNLGGRLSISKTSLYLITTKEKQYSLSYSPHRSGYFPH